MIRRPPKIILWFLAASWLLVACGSGDAETSPVEQPDAAPSETEAGPGDPASDDGTAPTPADPVDAGAEAAAEGDEGVLDEGSLVHGGSIEIKEYSLAFIGSGSLGKGTLRVGDTTLPFRIGGLGIGGIGVAKIDAHGSVYNLDDLGDFPGAYGKARIGATAADEGKGKLWLENTKGVVLELSADMAGLALTCGVDGVVVKWEADRSGLKSVQDGARKVWNDTRTGTRKAVDAVKKPFE